jgi:hypothetical protein
VEKLKIPQLLILLSPQIVAKSKQVRLHEVIASLSTTNSCALKKCSETQPDSVATAP